MMLAPPACRTVTPLSWSPAIACRGLPFSLFEAIPTTLSPKSPAEVLDYAVNMDAELAAESDAICRLSGSIATTSGYLGSSPLAFGWLTLSSGRPTFLLIGGSAGSSYAIDLIAETTGGRTIVVTVMIAIDGSVAWTRAASLSLGVLPTTAIELADGSLLGIDATSAFTVDLAPQDAVDADLTTVPLPPNAVVLAGLALATSDGALFVLS